MGVLEGDGEGEGRRGVDVPARQRNGGSGKLQFPEAPTLGDSFSVGMAIQQLEMDARHRVSARYLLQVNTSCIQPH